MPVREQQTQVKTRMGIEPETRQLDEEPGRTKLRLAKAIENKFESKGVRVINFGSLGMLPTSYI